MIKRTMIGTAATYAGGILLAFALQLLLARIMGAEEYGVYYYAMSWLLVLAPFVRIGIDFAVLRFVPMYIASEDWSGIRGMIRFGNMIVHLGGGFAILVMLGMIYFGSTLFSDKIRFTLIVMLPAFLLIGSVFLRQAILRSFQHPIYGILPDSIIMPGLVLLFTALLLALSVELTAPVAMGLTVAALFLSMLAGRQLQARLLPEAVSTATFRMEYRPWIAMSVSMLLINGLYLVLCNLDAVILGFFRPSQDVGVYGIASKVSYLTVFPTVVLIVILSPVVSRHHAAGQLLELQKTLNTVMKPASLAALAIGMVIILFGTHLLSIFGKDFVDGWWSLAILTCGYMLSVVLGPAGLLLTLTGNTKVTAAVYMAVTLANIALNLVLIPGYGKEAAAFVTALSIVMVNLLLHLIARIRLGIDSTGLFGQGGVVRHKPL